MLLWFGDRNDRLQDWGGEGREGAWKVNCGMVGLEESLKVIH